MARISSAILFLFLLALSAPCLMAQEAGDDLDADMEENMADGDSASVNARLTRERVIRERKELREKQAMAERARKEADAKITQANAQLAKDEAELSNLLAQKKKYEKAKETSEREIAGANFRLKVMTERLQRAKEDLAKIRQERLEQENVKREQAKKAAEIKDNLSKVELEKSRERKPASKSQQSVKPVAKPTEKSDPQ